MNRFNFIGLLEVVKALYSASAKDNTKVVMMSGKVKGDTTIHFKNISHIEVLNPKRERANGQILYVSSKGGE